VTGLRTFATLGLAAGAPIALVSGIFLGVTLIGGPPAILWIVFLGALGLTAVCALLTASIDAVERTAPHDRSGDGA